MLEECRLYHDQDFDKNNAIFNPDTDAYLQIEPFEALSIDTYHAETSINLTLR